MPSSLLILVVCLSLALLGWALERRRCSMASARAAACWHSRETVLRLLRLAVSDQRAIALTLFGHAESGLPAGPALTGLAQQLLDLANEITEQTETDDGPRHLSEEVLGLLAAVEFAVAQVTSHLGPSRRAWRIDPALEQTELLADRRALNQVLVNVLTAAASATRNGDWIELSAQASASGLLLVVQDEGVGLPLPQSGGAGADRGEARGIGMRLTLARSLMQAHGGSLAVESAERVGTRVQLAFPASRLPASCGSSRQAA